MTTGAASTTAKPRILLIHDMEGLSGQDDPYTFLFGNPKYPLGQKLLVDDVNAVIDGLFAGGAASVLVADGHGSGNPAPDLLLDKLDPRAHLISRPVAFDTYLDLAAAGTFDAVVVVGMHAKSGSGGFAAHALTTGAQIFINGHSITETELVGLLQGQVGVPVIFASGDDRLAENLRTMPWLQYVTTKKATGVSSAELYPVEKVHAEMRIKARVAVQQLASARVMTLHTPVTVAVRAVPPGNFRWLKEMPGIQYTDETVTFLAPDMSSAFRGIRTFIAALSFSFADAKLSAVMALPDAPRLLYEGRMEHYRRWFAAESHTLVVPQKSEPPREYHGFQ